MIEEAFTPLLMAVEKRKKELISDVESMALANKTKLRKQKEHLNQLNVVMKLTVHFVQRSIQSYSAEEFLAIQKVLYHSCLFLKGHYAAASLDPVDNVPMEARVYLEDLIAEVAFPGFVREILPCSPAHCSLVGISKRISIGIVAGVQRTLIVQACNRRGEPMQTGQLNVRAWVVINKRNFLQERVCDAEVSNPDQGKYTLSFCVCVPKQCTGEVHITVNGTYIDGSPFDVMVRDYVGILKPVHCLCTNGNPSHVYVTRNSGDVFVAFESGDVGVYSYRRSTFVGSTLGVRIPRGIVVDEDNKVMYILVAATRLSRQR